MLTRDIDIAVLSVRLSARLSRIGIVSKQFNVTYNTFFSIRYPNHSSFPSTT